MKELDLLKPRKRFTLILCHIAEIETIRNDLLMPSMEQIDPLEHNLEKLSLPPEPPPEELRTNPVMKQPVPEC